MAEPVAFVATQPRSFAFATGGEPPVWRWQRRVKLRRDLAEHGTHVDIEGLDR